MPEQDIRGLETNKIIVDEVQEITEEQEELLTKMKAELVEQVTREEIEAFEERLAETTANLEITEEIAVNPKGEKHDISAVRNVAPIHGKPQSGAKIAGRDIRGRVTPETKDTISKPGARSGMHHPVADKRVNQVNATTMMVGPRPRIQK
jgi:hypothetical protein